jgi:hypothetical protein
MVTFFCVDIFCLALTLFVVSNYFWLHLCVLFLMLDFGIMTLLFGFGPYIHNPIESTYNWIIKEFKLDLIMRWGYALFLIYKRYIHFEL